MTEPSWFNQEMDRREEVLSGGRQAKNRQTASQLERQQGFDEQTEKEERSQTELLILHPKVQLSIPAPPAGTD